MAGIEVSRRVGLQDLPTLNKNAKKWEFFLKEQFVPKVIDFVVLEKPPVAFEEKIKKDVAAGYENIVLYSNHQMHLNAFATAQASEYIIGLLREISISEEKFGWFRLLAAKSILTGHQGRDLQIVYEKVKELVAPKGLELVEIVRDKDIEKYGLVPQNKEETPAYQVINTFRKRCGLGFYPEASIEGGRRKGILGAIKGMQKIQEGMLANIFEYLDGKGGGLFIPMSVNGGYKIVSSDNYQLSKWIILASIFDFLPAFPIERAKLGMPINTGEIKHFFKGKEYTKEDIDTFLMLKVAEILPQSAQGDYRKDRLLERN